MVTGLIPMVEEKWQVLLTSWGRNALFLKDFGYGDSKLIFTMRRCLAKMFDTKDEAGVAAAQALSKYGYRWARAVPIEEKDER
jgi:hypothetical protein